MHQVPRHEGGIAAGEVVVEAFVSLAILLRVAIAGAGAGLADPSRVGLRRYRVTDMLQRIEHTHADVLYAVLIAGDHAAADLAVEGILPLVVGLARMRIEPFDQPLADRTFLAQPDRRAHDEDIRVRNLLPDRGPVVALDAVFGHVGIDPRRDVVIYQPYLLEGNAVAH